MNKEYGALVGAQGAASTKATSARAEAKSRRDAQRESARMHKARNDMSSARHGRSCNLEDRKSPDHLVQLEDARRGRTT